MDHMNALAVHTVIDPGHPAVMLINVTVRVMMKINSVAEQAGGIDQREREQQSRSGIAHKV
jgi:hypothetical protein